MAETLSGTRTDRLPKTARLLFHRRCVGDGPRTRCCQMRRVCARPRLWTAHGGHRTRVGWCPTMLQECRRGRTIIRQEASLVGPSHWVNRVDLSLLHLGRWARATGNWIIAADIRMLLQRRLQGLQELVDVTKDLKRHWWAIVAKGMRSLHELRWQPTQLRWKALAKLSVLSEQAGDLLAIATPKSPRARWPAACACIALASNRCGQTTLGCRSPQ